MYVRRHSSSDVRCQMSDGWVFARQLEWVVFLERIVAERMGGRWMEVAVSWLFQKAYNRGAGAISTDKKVKKDIPHGDSMNRYLAREIKVFATNERVHVRKAALFCRSVPSQPLSLHMVWYTPPLHGFVARITAF
jgi:hypothetical protein